MIRIITELVCDVEGCEGYFTGDAAGKPMARELLKAAREHGWTRRRFYDWMEDYCPKCSWEIAERAKEADDEAE